MKISGHLELDAVVATHRAAYDAFQVAPDDEAEDASGAMADALDALVLAACAFPILSQPLPAGAPSLLAHIRWWLAEEAEFVDDYQPAYGILQARAKDFAVVLESPAADDDDPVVAAIVAADMASAAHTVTLVHLDEDDDAEMQRANAAAHAASEAFVAVQRTMPATLAGLHTLTKFYERDAKLYERWSAGGGYLGHVAAALCLFIDREEQESLFPTDRSIRGTNRRLRSTNGVPGQPEVEAAWHALPAETRDRIGIIATDLVFQGFVYGDAYVASGDPKSRAVPGRSKAAKAIRAAASAAETRRLTELYRVVEAVLPDLFGPDGENPKWAVAMGALR